MNNVERKLRVFLCHSSNDKPIVRQLYQRLAAEGMEPWLDVEKLLPGHDWDYEIRKAVRESDAIVVCLSQTSVTKEGYVQKEIRMALDIADEKPEGTIFVIPLKLEECNVPMRLSRWQWCPLFAADGYTQLVRSLRARAAALGIAVIPPTTLTAMPPPNKPQTPATPQPKTARPDVQLPTSPIALDPKTLDDFLSGDSKRIRATIVRTPDLAVRVAYAQRLVEVIADYQKYPVQARLSAGNVLAYLGDPRDFDELVPVSAGEFLYGADHEIGQIGQPFLIGKYPVTNQQYKKFVDATQQAVPTHWDAQKHAYRAGKANHPVVDVSWNDAQAYCQWLSQTTREPYRLPTEEEWERAARHTDGREYPWGDEFDPNKANTQESGIGDTSPVGIFGNGAAVCGALDMAGNVWEWTSSYYAEDKLVLVLRGGSWLNEADNARCANRSRNVPHVRSDNVGFRVAESLS